MTAFISSALKIWYNFSSTPSKATQDSLSRYVDYIKTTNFTTEGYQQQLAELVKEIIGEKSWEFAQLPSLDSKHQWFSSSQLSEKQTYLIVICFLINERLQHGALSSSQLNWDKLTYWFDQTLASIKREDNQPVQKNAPRDYQLSRSSFSNLRLTESADRSLVLLIGSYTLFKFAKLKINCPANTLRNPHMKYYAPTHEVDNLCQTLNAYYLLALHDSINAPNSSTRKNHQLKIIAKENYNRPNNKTIISYLQNSAHSDSGDLLWIGDVICHTQPSDKQLSLAKVILLGAALILADNKSQLYQKIYSYNHVQTIILKRVAREIKVLYLDPTYLRVYTAFALNLTDIFHHHAELITGNFDNHQLLLQQIDNLQCTTDPKTGKCYILSPDSEKMPEMTVKFHYSKYDFKNCHEINETLTNLRQNFTHKYKEFNCEIDSNRFNLDSLAYAIKLYNQPIITALLTSKVTSASAIIRAILVPLDSELLEQIIISHKEIINTQLDDDKFKNVLTNSEPVLYPVYLKQPLTLAILYKNRTAVELLLKHEADTSLARSLINHLHHNPKYCSGMQLSTHYLKEVNKLINRANKSRKSTGANHRV